MGNVWKVVIIIVALGVLIQFVPYGRDHSNPMVTGEPPWDTPATRETFFLACKDCHSNETVWPVYSHIAPLSWLVQWDVEKGRAEFNVSEWGRPGENKGDDAAEEVREGEMPPFQYVMVHPEARLTDGQRVIFSSGLVSTFGAEEEQENDDD